MSELTHEDVDWLRRFQETSGAERAIWGVFGALSAILSAYHGYHRNHRSVGWGIVWFLGGTVAPIIAPTIAVFQGYAEPRTDEWRRVPIGLERGYERGLA